MYMQHISMQQISINLHAANLLLCSKSLMQQMSYAANCMQLIGSTKSDSVNFHAANPLIPLGHPVSWRVSSFLMILCFSNIHSVWKWSKKVSFSNLNFSAEKLVTIQIGKWNFRYETIWWNFSLDIYEKMMHRAWLKSQMRKVTKVGRTGN